MHFDPTINLGTVIAALVLGLTLFKGYNIVIREFMGLKNTLNAHSQTLLEHSAQMNRTETAMHERIAQQNDKMERFTDSFNRLTGQVQWIIGRIDVPERRERSGTEANRHRG